MDEVNGTPFGQYRLVELLGRGGMGEVWRAYDTVTDRVVALKVLPANFAQDSVFQQRFRREAHAAAQLNEPHVVPIHTYGEIDGRLFVDMRLIEGRDLQAVLAEAPLSPQRAVGIIEQVAQAVQAAHNVGLVHRDIKPSNILLDDNDFAYLIDFGIARAAGDTGLTSTGATIGTWSYMAPERFQSGAADARADIYALACVLYQSLTGQVPFPGQALEQIAVAHMTQPPPQPSALQAGVPAAMDQVIATGMAKNPDQRYANTVELARAARDATTVPFARPGQSVPVNPSPRRDQHAAPIHSRDTQLAATGAPSVLPPPLEPAEAQPTPRQPGWRRPRVLIPAIAAVVLLIAGGVFAVVKVSQHHNPTAAAPPPNTGPFTGTYTANLGPDTDMEGGQPGSPATETWSLRSVCRSGGCVATASRRSGDTTLVSTLVFDDVGGRWLAVGVGSGTCRSAPVERWEVFTLQPRPDGTLSGEYSSTSSHQCGLKRVVSFTRTGDADITSLPDPANQPPRVVSPAEALHGRYHRTDTYVDGSVTQGADYAVQTDCLRTGDRCMSFFHGTGAAQALLFGDTKWIFGAETQVVCPPSGTGHLKLTDELPLPAPPQDPITLLTGHGHAELTNAPANCVAEDYDIKYVRTGD
jgi:serine/threonine protein kinase